MANNLALGIVSSAAVSGTVGRAFQLTNHVLKMGWKAHSLKTTGFIGS